MNEDPKEPSRHEIWKMFDLISPTYDRVNRMMSFGLDRLWRKKMCSFLPGQKQMRVLDCATGTGDQIIAMMEKRADIAQAIGIDLSQEMVKIAQEKMGKKEYADRVLFQIASALSIPYPDDHFDCVTISFGIRNVTDVMAALQEFRRVLKPRGRLLILEGTVTRHKPLRFFHLMYLRYLLPRIGGLVSSNFKAYRYLNKTIETFPQGDKFAGKMRAAGFIDVHFHCILGGITTIYCGDKGAPLCH